MLGHASVTMAPYTYADFFDDDLDAVASRLDDATPLVALSAGPQTRCARPQDPAESRLLRYPRGFETPEMLVFGVPRRPEKHFTSTYSISQDATEKRQ